MTLDEQLRDLCEKHDLATITIDTHRGHRTWAHVQVQWMDDSRTHGRGIASGDHDVSIREGLEQALNRAAALRAQPVIVPALEAV